MLLTLNFPHLILSALTFLLLVYHIQLISLLLDFLWSLLDINFHIYKLYHCIKDNSDIICLIAFSADQFSSATMTFPFLHFFIDPVLRSQVTSVRVRVELCQGPWNKNIFLSPSHIIGHFSGHRIVEYILSIQDQASAVA